MKGIYYAGFVQWDMTGEGKLRHIFTLDDEQKQNRIKVMGKSREEVRTILATQALYIYTLGTQRFIPLLESEGLIIWQET